MKKAVFISLFGGLAVSAVLVTAQNVKGELSADQFPGNDIGAQINAATASGRCPESKCKVAVPAGHYDFATPVALPSGVTLECNGKGNTTLNWTGAGGAALTTTGTKFVAIRGCSIFAASASPASIGIKIMKSSYIDIDADIEGFGTSILVTGTDTVSSGNVHITGTSRNYLTAGIQLDHAVDTYITNFDNYAVARNPSHAWGLIIDTGTSGVNISQMTNGYSGTIIRNSMPSATPHGKAPNYLFADTLINDACYSNCMQFDKSLDIGSGSRNAFYGYNYECVDCWISGSQIPGSVGLEIDGGFGIKFIGPRIRHNNYHGIRIAGGSDVTITDAHINANNVGRNPDGDGIRVEAGVSNWKVIGGYSSSLIDYDLGGNQDYGIRIMPGNSDQFSIISLDASRNHSGPIFNGATGAHQTIFDVRDVNQNDVTFRSILSLEKGGTITTDESEIRPGACQKQPSLPVSGVTPSSTVTWAFSGAVPPRWDAGINVFPVVSPNQVTVYLCNPKSTPVTPGSAKLNIRVIN